MAIDLFIIDADGTIAPHLTVGLANKITRLYLNKCFNLGLEIKLSYTSETLRDIIRRIKNFSLVGKIKDYCSLVEICFYGVSLYVLKYSNDVLTNLFRVRLSNKLLLKIFLQVLKKVNYMAILVSKQILEKSLYHGVKKLLSENKKAKKIIISQSFSVKGENELIDIYKQILHVDEIYCNKLIIRINKIIGYELNVTGSKDKFRIALNYINKTKAKNMEKIWTLGIISLLSMQSALTQHSKKVEM